MEVDTEIAKIRAAIIQILLNVCNVVLEKRRRRIRLVGVQKKLQTSGVKVIWFCAGCFTW